LTSRANFLKKRKKVVRSTVRLKRTSARFGVFWGDGDKLVALVAAVWRPLFFERPPMSAPHAAPHDGAQPAAQDVVEEIVPMMPIVLPIVGAVLMFLLAFIAVTVA
jgi:hypothetical protein